jgi:hypothetical protein
VDLENSTDGVGKTIAGNGSLTTMAYVDTGLVLSGADQVTVAIYDQADYAKEAYGWIPPTADNKCGGTGAGALGDITAFKNYVTSQAEGEPIVSVQCWGDWGESGDPSNLDYNDYVVILSYNPGETTITDTVDEDEEELDEDEESTGGTSTTTTTSPSPSPSVSPSPTASASVAASPRAAQPAGSALPEAGVFEVTVGTMGIGLLLLALGVVGLLVL